MSVVVGWVVVCVVDGWCVWWLGCVCGGRVGAGVLVWVDGGVWGWLGGWCVWWLSEWVVCVVVGCVVGYACVCACDAALF